MAILITIRRPNGVEETVDVSSKFSAMSDQLFARIAADNRKAGRGECLRWEWTTDSRSPAESARQEVSRLQALAESLRDDPGRYFPALQTAQAAEAAWRRNHPAEAAAETHAQARRATERQARTAVFVARANKLQD